MCGIAGFFRDSGSSVEHARALVARMGDALEHRGPDGRGAWTNEDGRAGLAHTRLAILDLSEAAGQPMTSESGRWIIVFNGEIYNYLELRAALQREGFTFRTRSDTEVILRMVERHGLDAFSRLRGMFALAIWDTVERSAILVRDPLGIKPLYVWQRDGRLLFGSEVRALLASEEIDRTLDPAATAGYFLAGSVPEPLTLISSVRMLAPGTITTWRDGKSTTQRYWALRYGCAQDQLADDPVLRCRAALESSVRAHLVSDVPVALLLSGGMDSTALLALLHRLGLARELACFSIGVDDDALDESDVARQIARQFGAEHHVMSVNAKIATSLVRDYFHSLDVPSVDGFNTWLITRHLRQQGFKVAISGVGGDEIFGGYPSFWQLPRLRRVLRRVQRVPGLTSTASMALRRLGRGSRAARIADMLASDATLPSLYTSYRGLFSRNQARRLAAEFCGVPLTSVRLPQPITDVDDDDDELDQLSRLEIELYMRNQLLRDTDVTSMSNGVELRTPFVDAVLLDTLARIPARQRIRRGKRLLYEAVPEIPGYVANAQKRGFRLPFDKWLGQGLGQAWEAQPGQSAVQASEWYQTWAINVFCHWRQRHGIR